MFQLSICMRKRIRRNRFFGKIQCNNMIPAPESELTKINIEGITDIAYKTLLQKQVQFIRKNQDDILKSMLMSCM